MTWNTFLMIKFCLAVVGSSRPFRSRYNVRNWREAINIHFGPLKAVLGKLSCPYQLCLRACVIIIPRVVHCDSIRPFGGAVVLSSCPCCPAVHAVPLHETAVSKLFSCISATILCHVEVCFFFCLEIQKAAWHLKGAFSWFSWFPRFLRRGNPLLYITWK